LFWYFSTGNTGAVGYFISLHRSSSLSDPYYPYFLYFLYLFWDRVLLCRPVWPRSCQF
jgi:hypothetical protein